MDETTKDRKEFYTPAAVLIGALMISGAIVYSNGGIGDNVSSGNLAAGQIIEEKGSIYVEVAQQVGIDMEKFNSCVSERKYKDKVESDFQLGIQLGINGTPGGFVNGQQIRGAIPYEQLKALIDSELTGTSKTSLPTGLAIGGADHIQGNPNAKVTVVEFSDFQCPFCNRFHPTVKQAVREYGDKIQLVYKHFPLDQIHPQARPAAEVSECIAEQSKDGFWTFADVVFGNQERLKDL